MPLGGFNHLTFMKLYIGPHDSENNRNSQKINLIRLVLLKSRGKMILREHMDIILGEIKVEIMLGISNHSMRN